MGKSTLADGSGALASVMRMMMANCPWLVTAHTVPNSQRDRAGGKRPGMRTWLQTAVIDFAS
jgi:hypothetical protein